MEQHGSARNGTECRSAWNDSAEHQCHLNAQISADHRTDLSNIPYHISSWQQFLFRCHTSHHTIAHFISIKSTSSHSTEFLYKVRRSHSLHFHVSSRKISLNTVQHTSLRHYATSQQTALRHVQHIIAHPRCAMQDLAARSAVMLCPECDSPTPVVVGWDDLRLRFARHWPTEPQ